MCNFNKLKDYQDWGLLALRIAVGAVFIYHGVQKFGLWSADSGVALTSGMLVVMKILSVAETLGGAALILGFLTRWAALGFTIIMLGALYIKIQVWGIGFAGAQGVGWEFDLILLAASIHLFLVGAGKTALDNLMSRNT